MEFPFQVLDEETYRRERGDRIMPTSLKVGSICVARQIEEELPEGYAFDAYVRIHNLGSVNDNGQQIIDMITVDVDGRDITRNGMTLCGEAILGRDGIMYRHDGTSEDGYFPGATDPWDMSRLADLQAEGVEAPQLVSV